MVRQTSKGDTEFDMSVTVLAASGKETVTLAYVGVRAHNRLLLCRRDAVGGHKHLLVIWQPEACKTPWAAEAFTMNASHAQIL